MGAINGILMGVYAVVNVYQKNIFVISQPKHVMGTQKNRLSETVLLSTQNICGN